MRRRNSVLTKYNRQLMIFAVAEMILKGKLRSDIVEFIHTEYNYRIDTIKDIIVEANNYAAKIFTEDERKLKLRQIATLYEEIMFSDIEPSMFKLKAADQYSKLLKFYQPDVQLTQNINMSFDKLSDSQLKAIGNIIIQEEIDE